MTGEHLGEAYEVAYLASATMAGPAAAMAGLGLVSAAEPDIKALVGGICDSLSALRGSSDTLENAGIDRAVTYDTWFSQLKATMSGDRNLGRRAAALVNLFNKPGGKEVFGNIYSLTPETTWGEFIDHKLADVQPWNFDNTQAEFRTNLWGWLQLPQP